MLTQTESLYCAQINCRYNGGGTATGRAISFMISDLFGQVNASRHLNESVPRVGIVMTDGKSGDIVIGPAEAARAAGITLFAIGIGSGIDESELKEIGNNNVYLVDDFDVVNNIRSLISQSACEGMLHDKLLLSHYKISNLHFFFSILDHDKRLR